MKRIDGDDYCVVCGRYCGEGRHICSDCASGVGAKRYPRSFRECDKCVHKDIPAWSRQCWPCLAGETNNFKEVNDSNDRD